MLKQVKVKALKFRIKRPTNKQKHRGLDLNHFQLFCLELVFFFFFIVGGEKTAVNSERLENNKTTHQVTCEWRLAEKGATLLVTGNPRR